MDIHEQHDLQEFYRQRGPIERNIYIRSGRIPQVLVAKKQAAKAVHWFIMILVSAMFGFSFMALYDHALQRAADRNPFNQEN